ncbi:MAG: 7,8-didemethyl-8-hydroxy-5-deazariboflavin synthase CofG [Deltaproteobacteria bacterium]|nr:7,8-didemethyl-8-hydroxy-5-deazariboflavin synthase CofG [Deltaproteobacteria bacterium]
MTLHADQTSQIVDRAVDEARLGREEAEWLATHMAEPEVLAILQEGAHESKCRAQGDGVSFSRNVFIPLTNLCRDRCAYCTFAKTPDSPEAKTFSLDEVASLTRGGVQMGCIEALFCLGDKPEIAYRGHKQWLAAEGFASTAEYLVEACKVSFEGGMLPHTNAGILTAEEMTALRRWNASMGLMLESTSTRLRGKGQAHQYAPDKDPKLRLRMHEEAGELRIPFTSGMLLGIGENDAERVDTLFAIRDLHDRHGHIQEAIIQPFHPKPGTRMRWASSLPDAAVVGWVAMARLVLGRDIQVQAPPNLAPNLIGELMHSGVSDWGGVSPITVDYINPEAPWPALVELRDRCEAAGQVLVERLPVYPHHLSKPEFFDPSVLEVTRALANEDGYARPRLSLEAA